jgi:signal transduction histidine kinase
VTSHIAGIAIERKLIEQAELLKIEDERRLNAELTQAIQMRDEFLSIASHELSSPLALLKMQTELHKEMLEEGELSHDDMVQLFDNHAARLDKVIAAVRTMLDSSSASAGKLGIELPRF